MRTNTTYTTKQCFEASCCCSCCACFNMALLLMAWCKQPEQCLLASNCVCILSKLTSFLEWDCPSLSCHNSLCVCF